MSTAQAGDCSSAQLGSPRDKDGMAHYQKKLTRDTWHGIWEENKATDKRFLSVADLRGKIRCHLHPLYSILEPDGFAGLSCMLFEKNAQFNSQGD